MATVSNTVTTTCGFLTRVPPRPRSSMDRAAGFYPAPVQVRILWGAPVPSHLTVSFGTS